MTLRRFSSRRHRLDHAFLSDRLKGAKSYKRIAGYFRSSIFELVGEEISEVPKVQVVCNSELDAADVIVSRHARETALKERWNEAPAEVEALLHRERYRRLHELLTSGRVEVRVVPKDRVFIHGEAGVIEIQTEVHELWDLLLTLNAGADFVLGREFFGRWSSWEKSLPVVKGEELPADERDAWEWLRKPLPPADEDALFAALRLKLGLADRTFFTDRGFGSLGLLEQQALGQALEPGFLREHNPVVRHTVLRRRQTLEEAGLLEKVGVNIHPDLNAPATTYAGVVFNGLGLLTNPPFDLAYKAAEAFTDALQKRTKAAGFMKTLLLQRICSSFASGRLTAEKMLRREPLEEEEQPELLREAVGAMEPEEAFHLRTIVQELSRPEARDPKLAAVRYFLTEHRSEGKTWLEHGCIIFSQYYDTAFYLGSELAKALPGEPIGVYAGTGKSGLFRGEDFATVERTDIKAAVKKRDVRLVVATDAACEGLNLQTLGTLINVDLPWNPSRLGQRLGRIKRFGQARRNVDMLNLVYHDTQDEKVYQVLSRRMKDRYDIFGGLPDTIEDDWIESVEKLEEMMDEYIHLRRKARDAFEMRYQATIDPDRDRWELCSRVLARRDIVVDAMYVDKLDGRVDTEFFDRKAAERREEQQKCLELIREHQDANQTYLDEGIRLLELAQKAGRLFRQQSSAEKRRLLGFVLSNCTWKDGELTAEYRQPFDLLAKNVIALEKKKPAEQAQTGYFDNWLPGEDSNL